jgi:pimeloyl-ACP methyl ester carboxylesterase
MAASIASEFVRVKGAKIHYLEAGDPTAPCVLFLHGASFSAQTWAEIGSLQFLAARGYRAISVDLPSYGQSESFSSSGDRAEFLTEFFQAIGITQPVLVSPSMSGGYSLSLLAHSPERLSGFVAVAPVGIHRYANELEGVELPVLGIWGSNDSIVPAKQADRLVELMPNARKVILADAGHACYMRATDDFHKYLFKFLEELQ